MLRTVCLASSAILLLLCVTAGSASANGTHAKNNTANATLPALCNLSQDVYKINNLNSGLTLEVYGQATWAGAPVDQWGWWGGASQKWCRYPLGGQNFAWINIHSGLCLDVQGAATWAGAPVIQWTCNFHGNQQWIDLGGPIINGNSGLCLDMTGASKSPGARAEQWNCNGGSNQTWLPYGGY
jgi:hypothetical protein